MTLRDFVERWAREQGLDVPADVDSPEWRELFLLWAGRNRQPFTEATGRKAL